MGPTGSGKSDLAMRLAEELPLEIVSVDSALVYRGMDIGTAKPSAAMRARVAHHLIDIRDPAMSYSAGEFIREACAAMEDIWRRGRQPLLVGGTMLYFHALSAGIAELPEGGPRGARRTSNCRRRGEGWAAVHRELRTRGSGGGGANSCQRSAAHPARPRGLSADGRDHHETCNRSVCRRLPTSMSRNLRSPPLNAANCTPESKCASAPCWTQGFWLRCGRFSKEAISARNIHRCARSDIGSCGDIWRDYVRWTKQQIRQLRQRGNSRSGR